LIAFGCALGDNDPTLMISAINLVNRQPETAMFDVDVAVSYLMYALKQP